jgi:hypothetical protein
MLALACTASIVPILFLFLFFLVVWIISLTLLTVTSQLRPETDFSAELGPPIVRDSWRRDSVSGSASGKNAATRSLRQLPPLSTLAPLARTRKTSLTSLTSDNDGGSSSDEDDLSNQLVQSMRRLTLFDKEPQAKANRLLDAAYRFHGRSTAYDLVFSIQELRMKYRLESMGLDEDAIASEVGRLRDKNVTMHVRASEQGLRRREYWRSPDVSIRSSRW